MGQLKDEMTPYITQKEIKDLVKKLAQKIENDYRDREIILVCPLKGSMHFLADLCREINLPQRIDFVRVATISESRGEEPATRFVKDISINISNKHVLIVEEIIDAARTLLFLRDRLISANPASLKIVTLLDKPARRQVNLKPDYVGRVIEDRFVVGYGMDQSEVGRNYPDIYFPKH